MRLSASRTDRHRSRALISEATVRTSPKEADTFRGPFPAAAAAAASSYARQPFDINVRCIELPSRAFDRHKRLNGGEVR